MQSQNQKNMKISLINQNKVITINKAKIINKDKINLKHLTLKTTNFNINFIKK